MDLPFEFNGVMYDANDVIGLGDCLSNMKRILLSGFDREFLRKQKLEMRIPVETMSGRKVHLELSMDVPKEVLELHEGLAREISILHDTRAEYRITRPKPGDAPRAIAVKTFFNGRPRHVRAVRRLIDLLLDVELAPHFEVLREKLLAVVADFMAAVDQARVAPAAAMVAAE